MYYLTQPVFLKAFGDVDIVSSRKELDANGAIRAAFMGSFLSTASRFHGPHMEDVPGCEDTCPLCKNERGTWQHLMWECQANPPPVACPPNVLQRRFGWHLNSCDPDLNHAISGHIASTIQKIGIYAIRIDRIQPDSATHRFRSQESSRPVALEVNVEFTPVLSWRLARGRMLQLRAIFGRQLSPTTMMLSTYFMILLCPSQDDWTPMRLWLMPHLPEITRNPGRKCHHF